MDEPTLIRELTSGLVRFCVGLTGDPTAGEDLAQEALTALIVYRRRHGLPDDPRAFVFTVARRRSLPARFLRGRAEPLPELAGGADPERVAGWRERVRAIGRLLRCLPAAEREALLVAAEGDWTSEQAAGLLGISTSAFKMRVHRARTRLRELETSDARTRTVREA